MYKDIKNVGILLEVLKYDTRIPLWQQEVEFHIVFNVDMDFTSKALWVL